MLIANPVIKLVEWAVGTQRGQLLWPGYACLVGLLSTLYFGSLKEQLLNTDDHEAFQDHIAIEEDFTYFFSAHKQQPSGRPLAELVKFGAYLVWGNDPGFFHLLVVACHSLVAILVARLARSLGLSLKLSLLGGLLFLVNVAHFQAVYWIQAIEYPLALICGLGALLCYLRYLSTRKIRWIWGLYGGLLTGLSAHVAVAFVWPFCLYWSWLKNYSLRTTLRHLLPLLFLIVLVLALLVSITRRESHTWEALGFFAEDDLFILLSGMGRLLLWMLGRMLTTAHWLPVRLSEQQPWELWVGVAVLAALALLIYRQGFPQAPCSVWILLSVIPFLPLTDTDILRRPTGISQYLYPATVGSSLLLAWGIEAVRLRLRPWGRYIHSGIAGAIFISSYFSLKQAEAHYMYLSGRSYIARGDFDTGVEQLKRAIARGPKVIDLYDAYGRLCTLTLANIEVEEAEPILEEAISAFPGDPIFHLYKLVLDSVKADSTIQSQAQNKLAFFNKSGVIQVEEGRWLLRLSAKELEKYRFDIAVAFNNLCANFEKRGNIERAILACQRSVEFSPRLKTYQALAKLLLRAGLSEEAALTAFEAVERYPQEASSWLHIAAANVLLNLGNLNEAIAMCHKAMGKKPPAEQIQAVFTFYLQILNGDSRGVSSTSYTRMGLDFWQRGKLDESVRAYRKALEEVGDNSRAQFNLGLAYLTKGDVEEAERAYATAMGKFGGAGEERADAEEALHGLISRGIQVEAARNILEAYWPGR